MNLAKILSTLKKVPFVVAVALVGRLAVPRAMFPVPGVG